MFSMVNIVTGNIRSGKTSYLVDFYNKTKLGDGFVSEKIYAKDVFIGYSLRQLSKSEKIPWMLHIDHYHEEPNYDGSFGPYLIHLDSLSIVEREVEKMVQSKVSPIYIDEVGRLETSGGGFDAILKSLLARNIDVTIAVRRDFLKSVLKHYGIGDYKLYEIKEGEPWKI